MASITITDIRQNAVTDLTKSGITKNEASIEADILVEHVFKITKKDLLINPDKTVQEILLNKFNGLVQERINKRIPVQYLVNKAIFMGEEFYVDKNVLIPRPETEILVEESVKLIKNSIKNDLSIIDIGTGSGCVACMLAKKTGCKIIASDISEKALNVAKFNADKLDVADKVEFMQSDILAGINKNFDFIVSNPPYIPLKDRETLQFEISGHEPHLALFADDEKGISFYEKLIEQTEHKLNKNGYFLVEIGIFQAPYITELLNKAGFVGIKIIKDFNSIDRVVIAKK